MFVYIHVDGQPSFTISVSVGSRTQTVQGSVSEAYDSEVREIVTSGMVPNSYLLVCIYIDSTGHPRLQRMFNAWPCSTRAAYNTLPVQISALQYNLGVQCKTVYPL